MALIVYFSFILFSLTLAFGTDAAAVPMKCYFEESSAYPSVAQYCTIVLDSPENTTKKANDVCSEVESLFNEICSFNRFFKKNQFPQLQDVLESTCVVSCAKLQLLYVSNLLSESDTCESLCSEDPKLVAALLTVVQLKRFIAAAKENETTVPTEAPVKPTIGDAKENETTVPTEAPVKPTIGDAKKTERKVSTDAPAKPTIGAAKEIETTVPTEAPVKPTVGAAKEIETTVPTEAPVKPTVGATKKTEKTLSTEAPVKPTIGATKKTEKKVSTEAPAKPTIGATKKTETTVSTEKPTIGGTTDIENFYHGDTTNTEGPDNNPETNTDRNNHPEENEKTENSGTGEASKPILISEDTPSSYHFLAYFLTFIVLCVAGYIVFHNKQKIIAFIVEGKQGRRSGRPSTKQYTPLKSKVEDVMPYVEKSTTKTNYIY